VPVGTQIALTLSGGSGADQTVALPTPNGLPGIAVSSGGNYTDENGQQWICDTIDLAAGTYTKRCGTIPGYDGETIPGAYLSTTGGLTAGATVVYALATPVVTPLTEAQLTALRSIRTRDGTTVLTNDAGADMDLTYATRTGGGSYVEGVRQGLDDDVNRAQNAADAAQAAADAAAATADALDEIFRMWYSFTDEGMSVQKKTADGKPASIWSTLTDNTGFHIRRSDLLEKVFSAYKDRCRVQKLVIGNTMIKPSGNGGMVWVKAPQD